MIRNDAVVKQKEGATAPQKGDGYIALRELLAKSFTPEEIAEVDGAYALARQSHEGQHRYSGEPYIIHPICVARILAEMGMDKESVIAALLHDVVEDTDETLADITAKFGKTIAHLVDGVTKARQGAAFYQGGTAGGEYPQDAPCHVSGYPRDHH